jgi:alkaline phosphatase
MKRLLLTGFVFATYACLATAQNPAVIANHHEVKYVIFMVPDGMGLADVTAVRIQKNGISGSPLWLETLDHIGYQRTYTEKNTVTDSAAAASAWACGEKFVNNEICRHADGRPNNLSLLELAKLHGMATGLVATQTITHATPAAFAAHVNLRSCEQEIARQYVQLTQPDVMLGGGKSKFISTAADACGTGGDFAAQAVSQGYAFVTTKEELDVAVAAGGRKLVGLFANSNLTPEYLRASTPSAATQPRLPEMTNAALSVLEKNPAGFFVMIEGSLIDSGGTMTRIWRTSTANCQHSMKPSGRCLIGSTPAPNGASTPS